jgi:thiamine pyrophosphate-dependent acetolactate synthase large subunit-like protein
MPHYPGYRITSPDGWVIEAGDETSHQRVLAVLARLNETLSAPAAVQMSGVPAAPDTQPLREWWVRMMAQTEAQLAGSEADAPPSAERRCH